MNELGTIRYVALIEVDGCLVEAGSPVDPVSWLDTLTSSRGLKKSYIEASCVPEAECPSVASSIRTVKSLLQRFLVQIIITYVSMFCRCRRSRAEAGLVPSPSLKISTDAIEDTLDNVAQSEES